MAFSSYQIERLIDRLRRWITGPFPESSRNSDPVRFTQGGTEQGRISDRATVSHTGRSQSVRRSGVRAIAEGNPYPPLVEEERERRAGSFMTPPYPENPPPSHIPKLHREERSSSGDGFQGEGD